MPSRITGNSAVAGTDAAICASGCAMRARRGWKPMATPAGIAHAEAMISETATRRKVATAALTVSTSSADVTARSVWKASNTPYPTSNTITTASA